MGWTGGWGLHSHFHVQPNNCVEVVLRCVVVGVVTIGVDTIPVNLVKPVDTVQLKAGVPNG